jgi:hypothetical protein
LISSVHRLIVAAELPGVVAHGHGHAAAHHAVATGAPVLDPSARPCWIALYHLARWNPFTHAVELIRFALYG